MEEGRLEDVVFVVVWGLSCGTGAQVHVVFVGLCSSMEVRQQQRFCGVRVPGDVPVDMVISFRFCISCAFFSGLSLNDCRLRNSTVPCSGVFCCFDTGFGADMVDSSDLCSSVNSSSQVTYTVSSSLISSRLLCKNSNSVQTVESFSENIPSCLLLLMTQTNRTWRVTAPLGVLRNEVRLLFASWFAFSFQP